jgi:hypothetical protein
MYFIFVNDYKINDCPTYVNYNLKKKRIQLSCECYTDRNDLES